MNDSTIILIFYGIGALLCIIGGIVAIKYGKDLYLKGVGIESDGSSVQVNKTKIKLRTTGSVVMFTSVAWGILGYLIFPEYNNGETRIANNNIDSEIFVAKTIKGDVFDIYTSSVKVDSINSIKGWSGLAKNDITEAQVLMSYGYKNGVGFPINVDSSKFWLGEALKSEFALSKSVNIDSLKSTTAFMEIFKSIPKKEELSSLENQ